MNLIELQNIFFSYSEKGKNVLSDISLIVNKGDFLSLLGPNGSGKSSLLKILCGISSADSGTVKLSGKEISNYSHKEISKKIAFVPQTISAAFPFSVFEIVMMGRNPHLNILGFEKPIDHQKVIESLTLVELVDLKDKGINEISGGEAQRAFIARALAQDTDILIMDEPNVHLDLKYQISLFDIMKRLNKDENKTIITVSHDLNLAGKYSDRIILMKEGTVYSDSDVVNSLTEDNIKYVFGINTEVLGNNYNGVKVNLL